MVLLSERQRPIWFMALPPFTRCKFVHLRHRRIDVNGAHDLAEADAMFHRQHILTD